MIILLFGIVLTKKIVKEHKIVLMLDMQLFTESWRNFDALKSVFIQLESRSFGRQSQNFDRNVLETFRRVQNNRN